jgi:hypothetical protein
MKLCGIKRHCAVAKYSVVTICLLGMFAVSELQADAAPMQFGLNYYEFFEVINPYSGDNNSWWTARDAAAASNFNGASGHLATISSPAENAFLIGLVSGNYTGFTGAWLGGKAPEGWLVGPETGQSFIYMNWAGSEPNNNGYLYMSIGTNFGTPGQWADDSGVQGFPSLSPADPVIGYFVEYEGAAPVPEPATMLLLGTGLVGVAGAARRKKNQA